MQRAADCQPLKGALGEEPDVTENLNFVFLHAGLPQSSSQRLLCEIAPHGESADRPPSTAAPVAEAVEKVKQMLL